MWPKRSQDKQDDTNVIPNELRQSNETRRQKLSSEDEIREALRSIRGPSSIKWFVVTLVSSLFFTLIIIILAISVFRNNDSFKVFLGVEGIEKISTTSEQTPVSNLFGISLRRLELNYPSLVVIKRQQPIRLVAMVFDGNQPLSGIEVMFAPIGDASGYIDNTIKRTDENGQAWIDFSVAPDASGRSISIEVTADGIKRIALIQTIAEVANEDSISVVMDLDGDGLSDVQEQILKTAPDKQDSDDDGVSDGEEFFMFHSVPSQSNISHPGDNAQFRSTATTVAGTFQTKDVRLFNLRMLESDYAWVLIDARVDKGAIVVSTPDGTAGLIGPFAVPSSGIATKGTQLHDPAGDGAVWLELETDLPVVILRPLDDLNLLVRVFGLVAEENITSGEPTQ